jgi:hypothetical protein
MKIKKCLYITFIIITFMLAGPFMVSAFTQYGDVAPLGNRDGIVNVGDALVALRFALDLETYTQEDIEHGDIGPLDADGQPNPDGKITVGDALVILRKALGLVSWGADKAYTMEEYLPLDGSWETDQWTMFISQRERDVNGLKTKAMVDTLYPVVYYWTNDESGWRMHGFMFMEFDKDDVFFLKFSNPIIFADPFCKIGDKKEGTLTIEDAETEELKYKVTLIGVEDVSVPAGNFTNCLKFEIVIYPSNDDPNNYGSETLWLAKDVGFVKGKTDGNARGYIFTGNGVTRRLLSYNISKSSELTMDQKTIKDIYRKAEGFIADERLDDLMGLFSDSYISECVDKEAFHNNWQKMFDEHTDISFFMSPGEILINDSSAQVTIELLATGVHQESGQRWWDWKRYADFFIKENGVWKNHGDQLDFSPTWANVFVGRDSDNEYLVIDMDIADCDGEYITTPDNIASLTITGPPGISIDTDLKQNWLDDGSWRGFRKAENITNGTNGFYTFTLEDVNGKKWFFTDYLNLDLAQTLRTPELISPDDGVVDIAPGEVTLVWNPVDNSDYFWVDFMNISEARNESATQVVATCPANITCGWRVRARRFDIYGPWNGDYDYESTSHWRSFSTSAQ